MSYNWLGMKKIEWDEIKKLAAKGELAGYFKLYNDGTEAMIESDYDIEDIVNHYNTGGEFGEEKVIHDINQICPHCKKEVKIKNVGIQLCPNCNGIVLPCADCKKCSGTCDYKEDDLFKICNDKERNKEYWDELLVFTVSFLTKVSNYSLADKRICAFSHDTVHAILNIAVKEIEDRGGVFPNPQYVGTEFKK